MKIKIGQVRDYKDKVTNFSLVNIQMFLDYLNEEPKLFSRNCPHQGGLVEYDKQEKCFICPVHQWKFDAETGQSLNALQYQLTRYPVIEKNGELFAELPSVQAADEKDKEKLTDQTFIRHHAHACIEIVTKQFSLLCDPWLEGNAFLGAWAHYPPSATKVKDVAPDAIWISHEHSDHFHEPSLSKFDKTIPVYVPAFPNGRMEKKLKRLGFQTIHSVPFGKKIQLADQFFITIYEPSSLWNDAFVLIEANQLRILNLNDAGINRHIAHRIGPVDIVASSFSPGASGYPATWTHLTVDEKVAIMKKSQQGLLTMLEQAIDVYQADAILPFASHFTLWHDAHESFYKILQRNSMQDVVKHFENSKVTVIDLLPGDHWDAEQEKVVRGNREIPDLQSYIEQQKKINSTPLPLLDSTISKEQVQSYFERLNDVPEMIFSEDLTILVMWDEQKLYLEIKNGHLSKVNTLKAPNLIMKLPSNLLKWIVEQEESWDEATIGYWCEFSRDPDVYHADFWRLLQAPYYRKSAQISHVTEKDSIADIIEAKGEQAAKVMGRYGLYCVGCTGSTEETLEQGIKAHGLSMGSKDKLLQELSRL